jgi:hypothetical protein
MMAGATISANNHAVDIALSVQVWKEAATHIAYTPELDISSCGKTPSQGQVALARSGLPFHRGKRVPGILDGIPEKAGFERKRKSLKCVRWL